MLPGTGFNEIVKIYSCKSGAIVIFGNEIKLVVVTTKYEGI